MIRPAQTKDLPALIHLLQELFSIEEDFTFDAEKQAVGLTLLLGSETARILVAENNEKVVGMATAQLVVSTAEGGTAMVVEDVVVVKNMRQKGVATDLLTHLIDWGRGKGATRLQLLADKNNNPALEFYQKKGFTTTQLICLRKTL